MCLSMQHYTQVQEHQAIVEKLRKQVSETCDELMQAQSSVDSAMYVHLCALLLNSLVSSLQQCLVFHNCLSAMRANHSWYPPTRCNVMER
jgi:hypothetical protein